MSPRGRLPDIGRCIYCRSNVPPLQREHIIPDGIGGDLVLDRASCTVHAGITSDFEGGVLGKSWFAARQALGFRPSRKARPPRFPLKVAREGEEVTVHVPVEDYMPLLIFPVYDPPGHVVGRANADGVTVRGTVQVHLYKTSPEALARRHGGNVSASFTFEGHGFARMLAKIGYAYAVWALHPMGGLDRIAEAYVLPAILGEASDAGHWVGSLPDRVLGQPGLRHGLKFWVHNDEAFVRVSLFGDLGSPEYLVVVGRVA